MKKVLVLFLCVVLIVSVVSCATEKTELSGNTGAELKFNYSAINAHGAPFPSAKSLLEAADVVFLGKVVGIDFQVLNEKTALPATKETPKEDQVLYTMYKIEPISTYRGDSAELLQVRVQGGLCDDLIEQQLKVIDPWESFYSTNKDGSEGLVLPYWQNHQTVRCHVGESYLFVLRQFETGAPTILQINQSIYPLNTPTEAVHPADISVQNIIKEFGEDKWNDFYARWEKGEFEPISVE